MSPLVAQECYAYLLRCADGSLYSGWTTDLRRRLAAHNDGRGAKYTRSRRPVKLVSCWRFVTRSEAMKFEVYLKGLSRIQKERLSEQHANLQEAAFIPQVDF